MESPSYRLVHSSPHSEFSTEHDLSFEDEKSCEFPKKRSRKLWFIVLGVVLFLALILSPSYTDPAAISDTFRQHIHQPLCNTLDSATTALGSSLLPADPPARNSQLIQRKVVAKLRAGQPVTVGIVGGSISVGKSALPNNYAHLLEAWLNKEYPVLGGEEKHNVINKAVGGEISGVAAFCLETELPRSTNLDLLLLEFSYNDGGEYSHGTTADSGMAIGPAANYERMIRQALKWETAVMAVEFAGYENPPVLGDASGYFSIGAGHLHAQACVSYGVPIIDYPGMIYTVPHKEVVKSFYGTATDGIHPQMIGHTMTASLLIREILFHMNLASRLSVPWYKDFQVPYSGPSFPLLEDYPYHGLHATHHPSLTDADIPLSPIGPPRFIAREVDGWACYCSRIPDTAAQLNQSVILQEGFTYGIDLKDGGPFRSATRPGFLAEEENSHLIFKLPKHTTDIALLVRKSWYSSGQAEAWISRTDKPIPSESQSIEDCCPGGVTPIDGHWEAHSTQMTFAPICPQFLMEKECRFLHVRTVKKGYFKLYGFAIVEKLSDEFTNEN